MAVERTPGARTTKRYTPDRKARAVRLVRQLRKELGTNHGTIQRLAPDPSSADQSHVTQSDIRALQVMRSVYPCPVAMSSPASEWATPWRRHAGAT